MADGTIKPNEGFLARFFQRDSDTLLCWGNTGQLLFEIFHEWGDSFDPATGTTGTIDGERPDADSGSFEPDCEAGTPVFNGRLSGLWDCVEQAWPEDMAAMYRAMRAAGFNADSLWELFQSYRQQWCEALYAADAMGYANTGRFDMAYGDKSEALRHILKARFRYLDSKYGANTSTPLEFRLWGNGKGVVLRYYCPLYASLNWGAGGIITERAVKPGEPSYFPNPGTTFNETTFTVYNADLLTEISTYTELPDGTRTEGGLQDLATRCAISGLGNCRRLKKLELDYSEKEANTNLDGRVLEACRSVALRNMTVRNCPNVTGHADFESQVIQTIDFRGTGVTGITVPETDTLTAIRLGAATTELRFSHLAGLQTLTVESTDNLGVISLNECPGADIRPVLYEALMGDILREVSLHGVNWSNFGTQYLEKLADLGADITGSIAIAASANMPFALKQKCLAVWGDIDSGDNPLFISYTKRPVDIIRISGAGYYGEPGEYQLTVVPEDPYANDFTKIEWSMTPNSYADIDTLTGRVRVSRTGTEELAPTAEVTVTVTRADGTTVSKSTTVGFYERAAKLGDFVYADGSYSDIYDEERTVVAICCYIDPENPALRLGVAPHTIGSGPYGAEKGYTLTDDSAYNPVNIPGIPNTFINNTSVIPGRASETPVVWNASVNNSITRYGFVVLSGDILNHSEGETIPVGLYETLCAIRHRNKILRDSGINLPVPTASATETESECFKRLLAAANVTPGNGFRYYFPIFSLAYAYEPKVKEGEALSDRFKAHCWFVPAPGDLGIVAWHGKQTEGVDAIFSKAKTFLAMSFDGGNYNWRSTTGQNGEASAHIYLNTGTTASSMNGYFSKIMSSSVLPMVQF